MLLLFFTTTPKLYLLGLCLGFIVRLFTSLSCFFHFLFLHFLGVEKWKLFFSHIWVISDSTSFFIDSTSFINILLQTLLHVYLRIFRNRTVFFLLDLLETHKLPSKLGPSQDSQKNWSRRKENEYFISNLYRSHLRNTMFLKSLN